jgi:hypothetical protein
MWISPYLQHKTHRGRQYNPHLTRLSVVEICRKYHLILAPTSIGKMQSNITFIGTFVAVSVVCHATEISELRKLHYVLNPKAVKCSSVTKTNGVAAKVLRIQGVYLATLCKPGV